MAARFTWSRCGLTELDGRNGNELPSKSRLLRIEPGRRLGDLQYEEVSSTRTAVLNRESARMRGEGWNVWMAGDHLIAVADFFAPAYTATIFLADLVDSSAISKSGSGGGSALLGA